MERRKFILVPMGSAGDVHPFVWLAKLLQGRGHDVVMLAQEVIREIPERAGIRIVPVGNQGQQEAILSDPRLWNPRQAIHLLMEHIPEWARETLAAVDQEKTPETILMAGALGFGARIASERWNLPLVTVHLQPQVFMSVAESPVMAAGLEWLTKAPRWMRRAFFGLAHIHIDRALRNPVNALRQQAGIRDGGIGRGVMKHYWHSPDGVLCLFPEWFAKKAADWPKQAVLTRFPLYDESADRHLDAEIGKFLSAGGKPVVMTAGSANSQAARFFREGVEACRILGRRGMLLTKFAEQIPTDLPTGVQHFPYVPFSEVFTRAAAVVHHGGIGTMAQCFAAGVPQLIMPMAHDQPDNALRIKKLGVGDSLYPKVFTGQRIAAKLASLIESPEVAAACARVQNLTRVQMPSAEVAAIVEEMAVRGFQRRTRPSAS